MPAEDVVRMAAVDVLTCNGCAPLAASRRCDPVEVALEAEIGAGTGILPDVVIVEGLGDGRHRRSGS
ncbi:MAG: hypothetical protein IKN55_01285, partial [Oscillospiraceae bacterium]|nr:hypothetical protein [Oscillospiraceae bacterium]